MSATEQDAIRLAEWVNRNLPGRVATARGSSVFISEYREELTKVKS